MDFLDLADLWARLSGVVLIVNWYRRDCAALGSTSPNWSVGPHKNAS